MRRLLAVAFITLTPIVQCLAGESEVSAGSAQWTPDMLVAMTFSSHPVYRGISATDNKPGAIVVGEAMYGPFYAGSVWLTQDIEIPRITSEADFYFGVRPTLSKLRFDFNALYATYYPTPGSDYWIYTAGIATDITDEMTIGVNFHEAPDYAALDVNEFVVETKVQYKITDKISASGVLEVVNYDKLLNDYAAWNLGLSYSFTPAVVFDARYNNTSLSNAECPFPKACGPNFIFSVTLSTMLSQLLPSK